MFSTDADWYRAMAHWYGGNQASAIAILSTFEIGNYKEKAQQYIRISDRKE